MTSQFVAVFADLLDSCSDGIEVKYYKIIFKEKNSKCKRDS
jgi:hypothetical protein